MLACSAERPRAATTVERALAGYDPHDAAEVSRRIRVTAGLDDAVDEIVALYRRVIAEANTAPQPRPEDESRAVASYLHWMASTLRDVYSLDHRALHAERERDALRAAEAAFYRSGGGRLLQGYVLVKRRLVFPAFGFLTRLLRGQSADA